ncbi:MAG: tetratricopeptide repeat protein [Ferruginibacter sp.]
MRYILILMLNICLFSCNSKKDAVTPVSDSSSPEKKLQDAVKIYPDSIVLLQNLAAYYLDLQNFDAALSQINTAILKDSSNAELRDNQSIIYAQKGDTAQAIKSLETAVDLVAAPQYIISLGALYAQTKNPQAIAMADALLFAKNSGAEKEAYFIKGLYYSYNNEKEKAIPFFDECMSINYTFMDAYLEKAIALYDLKKYSEAATVLQKAITIQNNYDKGYYYLGRCYEKLNQKAAAVEAYQMALAYDPNYEEAKDALSKLQ